MFPLRVKILLCLLVVLLAYAGGYWSGSSSNVREEASISIAKNEKKTETKRETVKETKHPDGTVETITERDVRVVETDKSKSQETKSKTSPSPSNYSVEVRIPVRPNGYSEYEISVGKRLIWDIWGTVSHTSRSREISLGLRWEF